MKNSDFGVVVKVRDLDACRIFYRDVLGLGEPELDSCFVTVFRLQPSLTLTLEAADAAYLEHASSATLWSLTVDDPERLSEKLVDSGYAPLEPLDRGEGFGCRRGADPEGNIFYVFESTEA